MNQHAGDCTIYSSMVNGHPEDGICTCGFGFSPEGRLEPGDHVRYSEERLKAMHQEAERRSLTKARDLLFDCIRGLDLLGCDRTGAKGWPAYEAKKRAQDFLEGHEPDPGLRSVWSHLY